MRVSVVTNEEAFAGHRARFRLPLSLVDAGTAEAAEYVERPMGGELRINEPMSRHTSWRAGGRAERAYLPADLDDLVLYLRTLPREEPVLMVGLGSNLLIRDGGLRGTVILTHWALRELRLGGATDGGTAIYAQAGVPSPKVARFAALNELGGAEFLAGIPGTVGGALAMNAGCYGGETWEIVTAVQTIDRAGRVRARSRDDYDIGYRHVSLKASAAGQGSPFIAHSEEWFLSATFRLPGGNGAASRARITELLKRRIATQPLSQPNAGSVFRNPPGDYAARLIEACGLKGKAIGGARISERHANFIVNEGGASAADIEALIVLAERSVLEKFGVVLEREVRIVGEK